MESFLKENKAVLIFSCIAFYLSLVRYLRFKNIRTIREKYPDPEVVLRDPKIAEEIFSIMTKKEFPYTSRKGLEFALFKTYTIPTISSLLCSTKEFEKDCPRRVDDTDLILAEITDTYGRVKQQLKKNPNTPQADIDVQAQRAEAALNRMNELHGKYNILNGDYIYTLSLFTDEPVNWINRYEWRQLDIRERYALFRFWYDVGVKMNIKDLPDTPERMTQFKEEYARDHVRFANTNWRCGEPTLRLLVSNLPRFLQGIGYRVAIKFVPSLLDKQDALAFPIPEENKTLTSLFLKAMAVRAFIIRHFFLPRFNWVNRTPFYANKEGKFVPEFNIYPPVYPKGYKIPELGPVKFQPNECPAQCPVKH